jgi:energy-coupling factor transporter ATP-binding protein EcfA2
MSDTTTGTATSRASLVRQAVRRQTKARLALSGPSGSGKTWTALSIARIIAPTKQAVVIDTEPADDGQNAATLYADDFDFQSIDWQAPYDPRDLALTIRDLGRLYPGHVGIIDSGSHFWTGTGGTLDIADGRFGGWKTATPAQDELIQAILRSPMHWIVCTRAKQSYEVEQDSAGRQQVRKLGLAPIQRADMEYEFQVVVMLDDGHRMDVGKTRAAPLAGLSFPANQQGEFARVYAEWLDRGVLPAREAEIDAIPAALLQVPERQRPTARHDLTQQFGRARSLTDDQMPGVWNHLAALLDLDAHRFVDAGGDHAGMCSGCGVPEVARWHSPDADPMAPRQIVSAESGGSAPPAAADDAGDGDQAALPGTADPAPAPDELIDPHNEVAASQGDEPGAPPDDDDVTLPDGVEPHPTLDPEVVLDTIGDVLDQVAAMTPRAIVDELGERQLTQGGSAHQLSRRLAQAILADDPVNIVVTQDALKALAAAG